MNAQEINNLFTEVTLWKRGEQRAPHKPLLILLALSRCAQNANRLVRFNEVDPKLKQLLIDFGPRRKSYHPEYPFWRLQNDGFWELTNIENVSARKGNTDAKKSELIKYNVEGGFNREIYEYLSKNKHMIPDLAQSILERNFPNSIHEDILQAIGLDLELDKKIKLKRNPQFRDKILNAYEYQCAVCGFNVRIGNSLVALEAAHIKWYQAGGPDTEENGVALCALHHKLFERGAFTLSQDMKIKVSDKVHGTKGFSEWLMAYHGRKLNPPQRPSYYPKPQFINRHFKEVFQGYERYQENK
jgi:putative restriction endonuclease